MCVMGNLSSFLWTENCRINLKKLSNAKKKMNALLNYVKLKQSNICFLICSVSFGTSSSVRPFVDNFGRHVTMNLPVKNIRREKLLWIIQNTVVPLTRLLQPKATPFIRTDFRCLWDSEILLSCPAL
jgi:hypothetical protein